MTSDIVSPEQRSRIMASIRYKDTKPELTIRSALHRNGIRFRLHHKDLPGRPDLVFPRYRAVLFVNGCFWHGHECHLFKWPKTKKKFWVDKIERNRIRDQKHNFDLFQEGWRVAILWQCALKGKTRLEISEIVEIFMNWLISDSNKVVIKGDETRPTI